MVTHKQLNSESMKAAFSNLAESTSVPAWMINTSHKQNAAGAENTNVKTVANPNPSAGWLLTNPVNTNNSTNNAPLIKPAVSQIVKEKNVVLIYFIIKQKHFEFQSISTKKITS
jgi:hypothetical protein